MTDIVRFTRVIFHRFKAFKTFDLHLRDFNILVGPNNSGKSTILTAFRILAAGMRKARARKAETVKVHDGSSLGYVVDMNAISVAEENIFFDYDDSEPARVEFSLANGSSLQLHFTKPGSCVFLAEHPHGSSNTPKEFKEKFPCPIGFVPILGPVEHDEPLYNREAAQNALFSYQAARNFRNIWYYFPDEFDIFRGLIRETWPGMDVEKPVTHFTGKKNILHMFCPEERIPREIFWAGFGFQVWCQMLTHIVQGRRNAIFLIDEPDIYLHSELQRQLLCILRDLGPDILIATHSTEIISEAEPDEIVLIDKNRSSAKRVKDPSELGKVFVSLGSNLNPVLTQLAKTKRAVFVEGKDFQILGRLARKMGLVDVGNRRTFAVVPVEGFNPDRIKSLKKGIEVTLGTTISAAVILDRDFRSKSECDAIEKECSKFSEFVIIHSCKEIENGLLVASAIDRAANRKVADRQRRNGKAINYENIASSLLEKFCDSKKSYVASQWIAKRLQFERKQKSGLDEATANQKALEEFEQEWGIAAKRLAMAPGKDALSFVNQHLQSTFQISVSTSSIISAMRCDEVPTYIMPVIDLLKNFSLVPIELG